MSGNSTEAESTATIYEPVMNRSKKVRFYIPIEKEGSQTVVDDVVKRLCNRFGGATTIPGQGSYVMNDGELCQETVTLVESFTTDIDVAELTQIALDIKESLGEEAVAFETDSIETAFI
ncbi:hypothetical protein [Natronorubrum bangense]|uniref:Uncharacterized protein n=2 Tax=Natronorubrum bangense TaxID=61858 RepID=L9WKF8_9EURY|nr:hypothetical protein [Natronorubrum bangense]ELY49872.1 hypothetical protein C494_07675 [Natronorubrum bangense JCM 10635]QCC55491.1 hypothetical protein DV706_14050 [Natronorubrum bangense]